MTSRFADAPEKDYSKQKEQQEEYRANYGYYYCCRFLQLIGIATMQR